MFILDSLFLSGFRWVLDTVTTAAEAELNDDTALREQLLAAEMRREMGEMSDEEFAALEADLLARIREIKERREGGSGPIAFSAESADQSSPAAFSVEATVSGDFHEPEAATVAFEHHPVTVGDDHGTVIEGTLVEPKSASRRTVSPRRRTPRTVTTPRRKSRRPADAVRAATSRTVTPPRQNVASAPVAVPRPTRTPKPAAAASTGAKRRGSRAARPKTRA